jgi:hypothetical protein
MALALDDKKKLTFRLGILTFTEPCYNNVSSAFFEEICRASNPIRVNFSLHNPFSLFLETGT